jgi:hypothetical protein
MVGTLPFASGVFGDIGSLDPLPAIPPGIVVTVNGGDAGRVRLGSLTLHDVLGAQPNTGALTFATEVAPGAAVQVFYKYVTPESCLFSGIVQAQTREYASRPAITWWPAALVDQTFLANRRRPFGAFLNVSATTIAQTLLATFAPAFSAAGVQAGLPAVSITFDGSQPLVSCLTELAGLCGAWVKVDYARVVHLYIPPEASVPPPDPVDVAHPPLNAPPIAFETDLSQVRTRVYGKGHGEPVPTDVLANETILPVADVVMFPATGQAIVALTPDGAQTLRLAYTGVQLGGGGTIVGPGTGPNVAPIVQATAGTGLPAGTYRYAYTDVTAVGESKPSPVAAVAPGTLAPPSTAPTTAIEGAAGVEPGTYQHAVTFSLGAGETTGGPASTAVTSHDVAPPTAAGAVSENTGPTTATLWAVGDQIRVTVTFVTAAGETTAGPYSNTITATWAGSGAPPTWPHTLDVRNLPVPSDPLVTLKRLYLSRNGTVVLYQELAVATNDFLGWSGQYTAYSGLPTFNSAYARFIRLTNIPIGPAGTTARNIYRYTANDPTWKLQQTIADNTTATAIDQTSQGSLGRTMPITNTTVVAQVTLSGIATGPSGTTARRLYRSAVNASQLQLLPTGSTFANNTTTGPYVDVAADASLGASVPTSDTSGLPQGAGQVLPGSTTIPTSGTAPFAAAGGWALNGQLAIRYTGIAGDGITLMGIPATGPGAILTAMVFGSQLIPAPALTGVSGLTAAIANGSPVHIWVQRDDLAAQAALGQLERNPDGSPTDGIREYLIVDERRGAPSLIALCDADLAKFARPIVEVTYATFDRKTKAGLTVSVDLGWGPSGAFLIQDVTITIDETRAARPRYTVRASSSQFTFADLLQRVLIGPR